MDKTMAKFALSIVIILVSNLVISCYDCDTTPRVIGTFPKNGSIDVDPLTTELSVIFNTQMLDGNWSWVYEDKNSFPATTGKPYYVNNMTRNVLPVKLEENKEYVIWINQPAFSNFKDKSGKSVNPYKFTFKTRNID